jgi:hypothetical protein
MIYDDRLEHVEIDLFCVSLLQNDLFCFLKQIINLLAASSNAKNLSVVFNLHIGIQLISSFLIKIPPFLNISSDTGNFPGVHRS